MPPGTIGDCHRACIASLLELDAEDVPHFYDYPMDEGHEKGTEAQRMWLADQGLDYIELPIGGPTVSGALHFISHYTGELHYLFCGKSKTGNLHIVVARKDQIVHDPSFGDPHGIVGPDDAGYFWAGFIVKLL